ncbi:MAG: MBG domain-containing protein, partial [Pirellulaceae bacterium]
IACDDFRTTHDYYQRLHLDLSRVPGEGRISGSVWRPVSVCRRYLPQVSASGFTFERSGLVYEIQFVDGVLTVNPAPLTITANDAQKVDGDANPTFTVRYDGFVLDQ